MLRISVPVFNLVNNEYTVLGEYKTCHEKILFKHNICNKEYYVSPNKFLQGRRCPYCNKSIKKNKWNTNSFKEYLQKENNDYELLSKYINSDIKVKLLHKKCNNIYEIEPHYFLLGQRCPYCNIHIHETF